jgi:macrolide-specific efflux system membrane fusion protein
MVKASMRMWPRGIWFVLVAFLLAATAGTVWILTKPKIESQRLRIGPVVEAVYGLGTVIAPQTYQLKSAVNQRIREIFVKEGDQVAKGAPLVQFDDTAVNRAPFAGTVTSIPARKGELLFPSVPALTLVNLGDLFLEVLLEQQAVLRVKAGQKVVISVESIRGEKIQGVVQSVFPRDSQFVVRISMDHITMRLLPGMTADVAIEVGRKENALSIPLSAISAGRVTLKRNGKKVKETVQIGVTDGEWAEVLSGNVLPDDEVLVRSK